jgi:hypothetical protein
MWTNRGDNTGPHDNKPIAAEILQLRGELARLMGIQSFAHHALADRMARTPETALALLERTWASVKPRALAQIADYQADWPTAKGLRHPPGPLGPAVLRRKAEARTLRPRRRRRQGALAAGCRAAGPVLGRGPRARTGLQRLSPTHR